MQVMHFSILLDRVNILGAECPNKEKKCLYNRYVNFYNLES